MAEDYAIYIGGKPFMNYVTAVVMQFTTKGANKVIIRSRGKFISRAIDVAEVVRSRFLKDQVQIENMEVGSEEFKNKEGREVRVSTLDITLNKTGKAKKPAKKEEKKPEKKPEKKEEKTEKKTESKEETTETAQTEEAPKTE